MRISDEDLDKLCCGDGVEWMGTTLDFGTGELVDTWRFIEPKLILIDGLAMKLSYFCRRQLISVEAQVRVVRNKL